MKVAFCTHVSDAWFYSIGTDKLIKSAKHFHPDIPFYVFGDDAINKIFSLHQNFNWCTIHPVITEQLFPTYDFVVHFDADSMITGPLDELLNEETYKFDIVGVRNNNDEGKAGKDNPITEGYDINTYLNCGLVATPNPQFLQEWIANNINHGNSMPFQEQSILNHMAHSGNWKVKILDPIDSNVHYGISNAWGTNTHWDSWQELKVINNELYLRDKKVKVLHQAGGSQANKLDLNQFTPEVKQYLETIYGTI